jgi:Fanconi anemia group M protein
MPYTNEAHDKMGIRIIVDSRERNCELIGNIAELGIAIERETLPVGDYLISDRVCVERKTISDFESSIITGRLFEQVKRLKEAYAYPIIVIEGDREEFRMKSAVINGAISSLYIDYEIPIIATFGIADTAELLKYIAKHEQEKHAREPSVKGGARCFTEREFKERVVGNMPGIGIETARNLLNRFGTIKELACAEKKELMEVKNIGKKRAESVFRIVNSDYGECKEAGKQEITVQ